jgi:hypothetical protein
MSLIRCACLVSQDQWLQPDAYEVQGALAAARRRGLGPSLTDFSKQLALPERGSELLACWTSGDASIPYETWAALCRMAGLGVISSGVARHGLKMFTDKG